MNNKQSPHLMNEVERINLDDYTQTGEGGTSLTYTCKDGKTLAKLYNPGYEAEIAKEDFLTACTVYDLGIPSPKPYRLITDGVRVGAEYAVCRRMSSRPTALAVWHRAA